MSCRDCGFIPEPFKEWGFLDQPRPRWECDHSGLRCRFCNSCSAWWHRLDIEADHDEGDILHADCPECVEADAALVGVAR